SSLEHGKSAIWRVAHPLRHLSVRSISYYTRVKLSMQNQMRLPWWFVCLVKIAMVEAAQELAWE
ncbi:MAG: hypothetical protein OXT74_11330, partial [Candidatus Poribacteria bacterium]|nr:hypothetical protein [Candidatus Poribacteria bacterium]